MCFNRLLLLVSLSFTILFACAPAAVPPSVAECPEPVAPPSPEVSTPAASHTRESAPPGQTLPVAGAKMHPGYVQSVARLAYVWGWSLVNQMNRKAQVTKAPQPLLLNGVLPVAPQGRVAMLADYIDPRQTFVTCPNQDVVYGLGFFSLDEQPVIAQVPDFGERFWVYALYDQRTDQFGEMGKPYGTKPGFYLIVGPNWKGEKPVGVEAVVRSPTALANVIPRVFKDSSITDSEAVQQVIQQVVFYPLAEFDGKMKTTDWRKLPSVEGPKSDGETKWVIPEKFFTELGAALADVPPLPGEEALYAQFRAVLDAGEKDPEIREALAKVAVETERDVIDPFFAWERNGSPAGNGWNRSVHNAEFGLDYFNRTGTAKSNMFDNRPSETQYFYTDNDSVDTSLAGASSYEVTFPAGQEPPVKGFWSLTLYNEKHLFHSNALKRYSLGTKNKDLVRNADGSLTIYVGSKSPGVGRESNWLPAPKGHFSLYIRAYWGKPGIVDGTWKPPAVVRK
jgi:hypothetical protein